jgi:hypothetical protein
MTGAVYQRSPQTTRSVPDINHTPAHREGRARQPLTAEVERYVLNIGHKGYREFVCTETIFEKKKGPPKGDPLVVLSALVSPEPAQP